MSATAIMKKGQQASIQAVTWPSAEPEVAAPPPAPQRGWPTQVEAAAAAESPIPDLPPDSTHAFIWHHSREAAAVLRAWIAGPQEGLSDGPLAPLSARQLVAAFLAGLGPEVAPVVVAHLQEDGEAEYVAGALVQRATRGADSGLACLVDAAPEQVAPFLSHEHPQTIALILSQLDPTQAAGILARLPEGRK